MATYGRLIHDYIFFAYDMSNQLWLPIAGYLNYLSSTYVFISSFVSLTKYAGQKLKTVMWLRMAGKVMTTYFWSTVIWLMSRPLTVDNRPGFILHVDTYVFGYLLRSDKYVSNQYILDQNPRLSSYTIDVVAPYDGRIHVYICFHVRLFG